MKFSTKFILAFSLCLMFAQIINAQESYLYIGSSNGVKVYWKSVKIVDNYEVRYKFENNNSYAVAVSYDAKFNCSDGSVGEDDGSTQIKAYGEQSGAYAGLWAYPCDGGARPSRITMKLTVKQK
ncbi:MAG: hypothetical protein IPM59_12200 [Chloracidobacterium sp.]|nr:hypothetical protein [Chloracidobacterium sp.]